MWSCWRRSHRCYHHSHCYTRCCVGITTRGKYFDTAPYSTCKCPDSCRCRSVYVNNLEPHQLAMVRRSDSEFSFVRFNLPWSLSLQAWPKNAPDICRELLWHFPCVLCSCAPKFTMSPNVRDRAHLWQARWCVSGFSNNRCYVLCWTVISTF